MSNENPIPNLPPKLSSASALASKNEKASLMQFNNKESKPESITAKQLLLNSQQVENEELTVESAETFDDKTSNINESLAHIEITEQSVPDDVEHDVTSLGSEEDEVEEDNSHDDNLYGNSLEIIKHTGYLNTAIWAILTAAVTGLVAYFFTPGMSWLPLGVLGFFAGVIAAVDYKTHLIKNNHILVTAAVTVPLAIIVGLQLGWWNILGGVVSAILIMAIFLGLVIFVGFGSGGDIKYSPVPAFVLGVVNPLLPAIWFFYALIITALLLVIRKKKQTSFGEGMAIAAPLAIITVKFFYDLVGLPYL